MPMRWLACFAPECGPAAGDHGAGGDAPARSATERQPGQRRAAGQPTVGRTRRGRRSRHSSTTVIAMLAIEVSRCSATTHGLRSVSTLIPPMTACSGMIAEREQRQPQLAPLPPGEQRGDQRDRDQHAGQLAVRELDDLVIGRRAGRA